VVGTFPLGGYAFRPITRENLLR